MEGPFLLFPASSGSGTFPIQANLDQFLKPIPLRIRRLDKIVK